MLNFHFLNFIINIGLKLDKKNNIKSKILDPILLMLGNPSYDVKSKNNNLNILNLVNDYKKIKNGLIKRKV
ncbi:hypothetical protein QIA32_05190 (plasmid) [Borreliella valaisiana]